MLGSRVILDNARYVPRELADTRTPELKDYPSSRQMLLFRVSYPLGLVCDSICDCRHVCGDEGYSKTISSIDLLYVI
jgi:hypothetical protein